MQGIIDTGESSCWIVGKDEFDLDEDIFQELKNKMGYNTGHSAYSEDIKFQKFTGMGLNGFILK